MATFKPPTMTPSDTEESEGHVEEPSKADNLRLSHAGDYSIGHKSSKSTRRSTKSSISRSTERALIDAATRRIELRCQGEALAAKYAIEKEEIDLQTRARDLAHKKEKLNVQTELQIEEQKIAVLENYEDKPKSSLFDMLPRQDKRSSVSHWLENSSYQTRSVCNSDPKGTRVTSTTNPWDASRRNLDKAKERFNKQCDDKSLVSVCPTGNKQAPTESHDDDGSILSESVQHVTNIEGQRTSGERPILTRSPVGIHALSSQQTSGPTTPACAQSNVKEGLEQIDTSCRPKEPRQQLTELRTVQNNSLPEVNSPPQHVNMTHAYSDTARDGGDDYLAFPVYRPTPDPEGLNSRYNTPKNSPPQQVNMTHAYSDTACDGGDDYLAFPVYRPTPDPEGLNSRYNTPKISSPWQYDQAYRRVNEHGLYVPELVNRNYMYNTSQVSGGYDDLARLLCLPKQKLKPFSGDPLEFATFERGFRYMIEDKTSSERDRLNFLEQFTEGDAKTLVRSCLHMSDDVGYKEAKRMLQRKYGNKHKMAEAYLSKMRQWPDVKGDKSLQELSLFLLESKNTMSSLGYLPELNSTSNIRMLMMKLPYSLRENWRKKVDYIEEECNEVVTFDNFVFFLEKQAWIATNPGYGRSITEDTASPSSKNSSKPKGRRIAAAATSVTSQDTSNKKTHQATEKPCCYCHGDNHSLESCFKLRDKPIKERLKYLRELGVCFGCFKTATHYSKVCKKKLVCSTCNKQHPTVLHLDKAVKQETSQKEDKSASERSQQGQSQKDKSQVKQHTCGLTGAGVTEAYPTIIPVIVHCKDSGASVETYAYLDDGSDAVFCTETLYKQLNAKGRETTLQINTINEERAVKSREMDDLEVSDMERRNIIGLGKVYTSKSIPANMENIVTQDDIKSWPYLKKLKLNRVPHGDNVHIGILIGNNVPRAYEPLDVINSQDDGPFACRSLLGWTVHGVPKATPSCTTGISAYRTQVNIEDQLVKLYNHDFQESLHDETPERSLNDKRFLAMLKKPSSLPSMDIMRLAYRSTIRRSNSLIIRLKQRSGWHT